MTRSDHLFSLEKFMYSGICNTCSADTHVTDSADGWTAIALWTKTKNGMVIVTPDIANIISILESVI
jgi:alkaline phosphatase